MRCRYFTVRVRFRVRVSVRVTGSVRELVLWYRVITLKEVYLLTTSQVSVRVSGTDSA